MSETGLSLWDIEATIAQLLEMREEALLSCGDKLMDPDHGAEAAESLRTIEAELARYIGETLPAKVDGYIGIIRRDETVADAAEAEAARLTVIAKRRRDRVAWLKQNALAVMQATGKKRLEGSAGRVLKVQANGGAQPAVITKPSLLPEEMVGYEGYISSSAWAWIGSALGTTLSKEWKERQDVRMARVPRLKDIGAELNRPCAKCDMGVVRYTVSDASGGPREVEEPCPECDGTGKRKVSGAHLGERGVHLRVE